ncbi:MAG: hypothetical protein QF714_08040 [Dehalococcoidia bacterium]|jgi:hypothetical protein|nr:hypothetical protein [Dehalococcoidia bacterium]MDP6227638.1 hypothetical protein [Dehalococcoidia bacterium]MDP7083785.1 hypothetical protein [Dehalococcoidia bacterium]MDP7201111.1 hypothetical protein [Dehalococcoidia bacterium]MDP7510696.1 hypothetical protein [Dehalococcoidia bacterium]
MAEGIIDMGDMEVIFSVTDTLGIHRESVSVELSKEDPGSIGRTADGKIEITVPESGTIEEFSGRLRAELEGLGYTFREPEEDEEESWL